MTILRRSLLVATLAFGLGAGRAQAFDAQAFAPAVDARGYFSVYSSSVAPEGRFHLGLAADFADAPVSEGGLVDQLITGHLYGGFSVLDGVELGLDIPVSQIDSGAEGVDEGFGLDAVRILGRFRIADATQAAVGFALVPFVDLPTGGSDRLTVSGGTDYGLLGVLDHEDGRFRTALNLGFRVTAGGVTEVDEILFGTAFGWMLVPSLELLAEVFGSTSQQSPFEGSFVTPVEAHAGARWSPSESPWFVRLGAGRAITDGVNGPDLRISLALGYAPGPPRSVPPAPPAPPVRVADVVVTDEEVVPLAPVLFETGRARLLPEAHGILDRVAEVLRSRPDTRWRVEGHTDAVGARGDNVTLSFDRARAVVAALVERGVAPDRLEPVGLGEDRPVASNETSGGRARNRRTEFHRIR